MHVGLTTASKCHKGDELLCNTPNLVVNKKSSDYGRLDSFLRRCVKLGYAEQSATVTDVFSEADVLYSYLPDRPKIV